MRTYDDIIEDFLNFKARTTQDSRFLPDNYLKDATDEDRAVILKGIVDKFYDRNEGLFYFIKFGLGNLEYMNEKYKFNTLLRKWDKLIRKHKRIAIRCARGHGKSAFFSGVFPVFNSFLFSGQKIILVSASSEQAEENMSFIKKLISGNELLNSRKSKDSRWAVDRITYNGGYILAKGITSEIRGKHVDYVIIDDILRSDNKISEEEIEHFIDADVEPMLLDRKGRLIVVGTPKSEVDVFSYLIKKSQMKGSQWRSFRFPAILDFETKKILCPSRFTWGQIMQKRLDLGAWAFEKEYQVMFRSKERGLFPASLIKPAIDKGKEIGFIYKADEGDVSDGWYYYVGVDVARSGAASADYTVITVLGYNPESNIKKIVYVWRQKGYKISKQVEEMARIARNFNHATVLVEKNNFGQDFIDDLADNHNISVEAFTTGGRGQEKENLIRFLINTFEHEKLIIPRGDDETRELTNIIIDELKSFCVVPTKAGNETMRGIGAHDDCVMSLAIANKCTQFSGGVACAVTKFGETVGSLSDESDLVEKIRLGMIK